jgi:hypothetical protein
VRNADTLYYYIHNSYVYILYNFIKIVIELKYYLVNLSILYILRVFGQFCGQYNWTNVSIGYIRRKENNKIQSKNSDENNKLLTLCNQHQNKEIILNF